MNLLRPTPPGSTQLMHRLSCLPQTHRLGTAGVFRHRHDSSSVKHRAMARTITTAGNVLSSIVRGSGQQAWAASVPCRPAISSVAAGRCGGSASSLPAPIPVWDVGVCCPVLARAGLSFVVLSGLSFVAHLAVLLSQEISDDLRWRTTPGSPAAPVGPPALVQPGPFPGFGWMPYSSQALATSGPSLAPAGLSAFARPIYAHSLWCATVPL